MKFTVNLSQSDIDRIDRIGVMLDVPPAARGKHTGKATNRSRVIALLIAQGERLASVGIIKKDKEQSE